nr:MAG TPA: hypothetical protein [Caudoviricetes sp.]
MSVRQKSVQWLHTCMKALHTFLESHRNRGTFANESGRGVP